MLDVNKKAHTGYQSSIAQWAYQALELKGVRLRIRLQRHELHILCESTQCPEAATVVPRFLHALNASGTTNGFPAHPEHPIYQIVLYGRAFERQRPDWVEAVHLNQLDQQTSRWQRQRRGVKDQDSEAGESVTSSPQQPSNSTLPQESATPEAALLVSNESQAQSGQPEAIARYLSEALSDLGVSVKVLVQDASANLSKNAIALEGMNDLTLKELNASSTQREVSREAPPPAKDRRHETTASTTHHSPNRRLWVVCNADYSPDPSLVAQAVTQRLRELKLEGFHDARISAVVSGETLPDWVLRVDMTPPEEMLKDWARWGDVQAIARLLEQALANQKVQVRAVLKQATLHLFTRNIPALKESQSPQEKPVSWQAPDKQTVIDAITSVLESIGPQGIQAAMVYGMAQTKEQEDGSIAFSPAPLSSQSPSETPVWNEWLNLPACCCPALAESALALAQHGDESALVFLLQRLLNSDLDWRLATGGIRVSVRRKQDLLHVMTEAPVCPLQGQVASPIVKLIRQVEIPKIAGVRVYGRRAGQASPLWSYGVDFTPRTRKAPPVEFAASADYAPLQLTNLVSLQPPSGDEISGVSKLSQTLQALSNTLASGLCATQLFIPTAQDKEGHWSFALGQSSSAFDKKQRKVAIVWGCLGLLLTFQSDWLVGQMLRPLVESTQLSAVTASGQTAALKPIPQMSLQKKGASNLKTGRDKAATFNSSGFTKNGETSVTVTELDDASNFHKVERVSAGGAAVLAAARSKLPSFNNRLLDEKLALYQQRLLQRGGVPPEVLIVGSSRAMRGIDPTALRNSLAAVGFGNIEVFNFGINGATAQVVDLMLRRILPSSQLPKLIIWADGARAFNSGRMDATFNAIATSAGYQQLNAGTFPIQHAPSLAVTAAEPKGSLAPSESKNSLFGPSLTSGYQALETQLNQLLAKVSSTYPQRAQLASLITGYFARLIPMSAEDEGIALGSNVREEDGEANLIHLNSDIDFDGFLPLSIRFVPAIYYKHHARVSGDYDGDYDSFQMVGQQDKALAALLQFVHDNQIQLVFVNLPLTKDYLDQVRAQHEQEFQQHMRQVALEKGLIFRDLSGLWPTKNEYFSDPSHLNQYGAFEVSNQLIQDPMIPWPLVTYSRR